MSRQLQPINLVAPGFRGLNLSQQGALLTGDYATRAENCVIDSAGRLAARFGYAPDDNKVDITSNPAVKNLFEYIDEDGNSETLVTWDGGIANDIVDPEGNDISGAVVDAEGTWWFQNFHDNCLGFQDGQRPIVYNGTGTFAPVVENSGTAPISHRGIGLAAFGRVWAVGSDSQTIQYSALLDETRWDTADGAGSIDMSSVWTDGTDSVTAIAAFNGQLIVFGNRHIVFWYDGQGSALGLNPENIFVNDVVTGTGCVSQHTIQAVGETDMLYLGSNGVQSIRRVQGSSNSISTATKNVRNDLLNQMIGVDYDTLRTTYSALHGIYLLTFPSTGVDAGKTYCIDQRYPFQDKDGSVLNIITTWTLAPTAWLTKDDTTVLLGDTVGVSTYSVLFESDNGAAFRFVYQSPWIQLSEQVSDRLKMLKRIGAILFVVNNTTITFKWSVDFDESTDSMQRTVETDTDAEYGDAEYGIDEYGGGLSLRILKIPARDKGQYFRLGIESEVTGQFAIQQLELFTKMGRLA